MQCLSNKQAQVCAWQLGAFGNKLKTWTTPAQVPGIRYRTSTAKRDLALRSKITGGPFYPRLTWDEVDARWNPDFYVCEMAPHDHEIVQGEIQRDAGGLYFYYTFLQETMRVAMKYPCAWREMRGYKVNLYLQSVMLPLSWIELQDCLDLHPDAVVEFTVFDYFVGDRPGRNTIIWECRSHY